MASLIDGYVFGATEQVTSAKLQAQFTSGSVGSIATGDISDSAITDAKIQSVSGAKFTSLSSIPAGAGVIPSANIPTTAPAVDPGIVQLWGGLISTIPSGYLFCDGSAVSRTTYAALFAAIGTLHGTGDGSLTFNLPDYRDVSIVGAKQDSGGYPKTNISGSLTFSGGEATHTLTSSEMPSHYHTADIYKGDGEGSAQRFSGSYAASLTGTANIGSAGSGAAHNNLHPYKSAIYIIKT